jgi:glucosyl-3-phosphoglycerate synthase
VTHLDFYQRGPTTLHDLQPERRGHARALVAKAVTRRPAAVVLPMLSSEMGQPAILGVRQGLARADFLREIIIPVSATCQAEVDEVARFFRDLPYPVTTLWCEGPAVVEVMDRLSERGLDLRAFRGKGLAVWLGFGAASEENHAIVVHDANIERYDPKIVHRLLLPLVVEDMDFFFAKGYYAHLHGERLYGRAVRLFVWPFLDALQTVLPRRSPLLTYLRGFRYPLSGEMAVAASVARNMRIPTDWGAELGILGEIHRTTAPMRICQVDLGQHSHDRRPVGATPAEGLQRVVLDLGTTVYRLLAGMEGTVVDDAMLTTMRVAYHREAQDAIRKYAADALANGLQYDRHEEEVVAERFETLVAQAGRAFLQAPLSQQISEWLRATSADPEAPRRLRGSCVPTLKETSLLREAARAGVS